MHNTTTWHAVYRPFNLPPQLPMAILRDLDVVSPLQALLISPQSVYDRWRRFQSLMWGRSQRDV